MESLTKLINGCNDGGVIVEIIDFSHRADFPVRVKTQPRHTGYLLMQPIQKLYLLLVPQKRLAPSGAIKLEHHFSLAVAELAFDLTGQPINSIRNFIVISAS